MKRSRFTETQILNILKLQESGLTVDEISRQHGISPATFYNWKKKYSGMEASELRKLKHMESELAQFKRMYAELARENDALKDLIEKKL
jgi:putative transposase